MNLQVDRMNKVDVDGVELGTKYEGNNCDKSKSDALQTMFVLINGHYSNAWNMTYTFIISDQVCIDLRCIFWANVLESISANPQYGYYGTVEQ